jgi:hypothetical protein
MFIVRTWYNLPMKQTTIIKQPSALLLLAMSIAALALVVGHIALVGVARQADEGPLPISGSSSWLDRYQWWPSSPSSSSRGVQRKHCWCCKLPLRSWLWHQCFCSTGKHDHGPCASPYPSSVTKLIVSLMFCYLDFVTGFVTRGYAPLPRISGVLGDVSKRVLFVIRSGR